MLNQLFKIRFTRTLSIQFVSMVGCIGLVSFHALAGSGSDPIQSSGEVNTRYGLFQLLDHRSAYGDDLFPEPFLVDDTSLETDEARLDWFTTRGPGNQTSDNVKAEIEKGFGVVTFELEIPYQRQTGPDQMIQGMGPISVGVRSPVFQCVTQNGLIDNTVGVGFEAAFPTNSQVSTTSEIVPKLFNDLKIGRNFTLQTIVGYSVQSGSGEDAGLRAFEYGVVVGYRIRHRDLPLPGIVQITPIFELQGETDLNHDNSGQNSLIADVGLRINTRSIGPIQPRPGIAYVFPIDQGGRQQMQRGLILSLVFEY